MMRFLGIGFATALSALAFGVAPAIAADIDLEIYNNCEQALMDSAIIDDNEIVDPDYQHRVYVHVAMDGSVGVNFGLETDPSTPVLVSYADGMTFNGRAIGEVVERDALNCADATNQVRAAMLLNGVVFTPDFDIRQAVNQAVIPDTRIVFVRIPGNAPVYKAERVPLGDNRPFGLKLPDGIGTVLGELQLPYEALARKVGSAYEHLRIQGFEILTAEDLTAPEDQLSLEIAPDTAIYAYHD